MSCKIRSQDASLPTGIGLIRNDVHFDLSKSRLAAAGRRAPRRLLAALALSAGTSSTRRRRIRRPAVRQRPRRCCALTTCDPTNPFTPATTTTRPIADLILLESVGTEGSAPRRIGHAPAPRAPTPSNFIRGPQRRQTGSLLRSLVAGDRFECLVRRACTTSPTEQKWASRMWSVNEAWMAGAYVYSDVSVARA